MRVQQRVDRGALGIGDICDDQILIRRDAKFAIVDARDRGQRLTPIATVAVRDSPSLDAHCQVPVAVLAAHPAEAIAAVLEVERARRGETKAEALLDFSLEPVDAMRFDRVFESRMLAHNAVAEVALRGDHGFRCCQQLNGRNKPDHIGEPRKRRGIAMRAAHAAANAKVESDQLAVFDDGDEAEVLRKNIDVVQRRHRDRCLEFSRQIGWPVDRFAFTRCAFAVFAQALINPILINPFLINPNAIEPDLVIRAGLGQQMFGQSACPFQRFGVRAA